MSSDAARPGGRFDWERFLRTHRVEYVTSGPNVKAGEVNVRCPMCGPADPSHHMGISLVGRGWSCLRNRRAHSGRSRAYLIQRLLRCTAEDARRLAGYDSVPARGDDDLAAVLRSLGTEQSAPPPRPRMPREFRPVKSGSPMAAPFVDYLARRGYAGAELAWAVRAYDLRYATSGPFAYRLVIPVRDRRGGLLSWTGRSIDPGAELRYRTLSADPERSSYGQVAAVATSRTLLGLDLLWDAPRTRALVVCEGPMDAVRLSTFGHAVGVYGTCLFGLNVGEDQVAELEVLTERFPAVYLCIDAGEELRRTAMLARLETVDAVPLDLPPGVKDPGDISAAQAADLCLGLTGAPSGTIVAVR